MRLLIGVLFALSTVAAFAQDPTQQILLNQQVQQANMQAAQQASQQATQQAQQDLQQSMDMTQQANQRAAASAAECRICLPKPRFSIKPGAYPSKIAVRLKDSARSTTIYYTTDGWTPTALSTRYTGPITLSYTTTLQAIAVGPTNQRSMIAWAAYTLPNGTSASGPYTSSQAGSGMWPQRRGAPALLVFTSPVTTQGMQVGDKLPIVLAQDLTVDGVLVAPRATPVLATVTQVDHPGLGGAPGILSFAIRSITVGGRTIHLSGAETKEGQPRANAESYLGIIPFVALPLAFIRGKDAEIPKGATLTAYVDMTASLSTTKQAVNLPNP